MSRAPATGRPDLADLPDIDDKPRAVEAMFDRIAPRYDALNRLLTFRMDVGWRRSAVRALALPDSSRVLDLACGTGDLCRTLIRAGHRHHYDAAVFASSGASALSATNSGTQVLPSWQRSGVESPANAVSSFSCAALHGSC